MLRTAQEVVDIASALAVGPGLGQSEDARTLLEAAIARPVPLVLDADALNLIAFHPALAQQVAQRGAPTAITPHPAEAGRLLGSTAAAVQADRVAAACELARRLNCHAVVKGCGSVVAAPDGPWYINRSGNPGMASAGMGDVLTGIALALLAQGWSALPALLAAVHVHGAAADALAARGEGPSGLAAGELIVPARRLLNAWIACRVVAARRQPVGTPSRYRPGEHGRSGRRFVIPASAGSAACRGVQGDGSAAATPSCCARARRPRCGAVGHGGSDLRHRRAPAGWMCARRRFPARCPGTARWSGESLPGRDGRRVRNSAWTDRTAPNAPGRARVRSNGRAAAACGSPFPRWRPRLMPVATARPSTTRTISFRLACTIQSPPTVGREEPGPAWG
ncbi:MAG: NAD(P)H-hydrate dehydratase [Comamonadaceae bacterium]|nr:NAD(P)H-hydrate dehydratase [Comamonadaceae bacterium]